MPPHQDACGQLPLDALPTQPWDVLVVGAGPAGSIAALHLARHGHRVLLADRARWPRTKVCGDGLLYDAHDSLRNAGLYKQVEQKAQMVDHASAFSPGGVEVVVSSRYLLLKRVHLDTILAKGAVDAGVTFVHGELTDIASTPDGHVVAHFAGSGAEVRARIALIATGVSLRLARQLQPIGRHLPFAVGLRSYVRSPVALDRMVTFYDRQALPGYAWVFPLGDGEFNVGFVEVRRDGHAKGENLRRAFKRVLADFPLTNRLMDEATAVGPPQGAMLRGGLHGAPPLLARNVLAAGETIGSTLPLTGEGVGRAMHTGSMAADAIHAALQADDLIQLHAYPRRVSAELRPRHMAYGAAEWCASVPWLNDFIARRAQEGHALHNIAVGVVSGNNQSRGARALRSVFGLAARLGHRNGRPTSQV